MTSGSFHSIEIASISVNREGRQRRVLDNISSLADSIRRLNLINPICINRSNELVAGERRLAAARSLGWTHIPCHYTDELEPTVLRAIELEENIKREVLPWQDECRAVLEYHQLRHSEESSWSDEKTGEALGLDQTAISRRIAVAKELVKGNPKIIAAPKFSTARGIVERAQSRQAEESLQSLRGGTSPKIDESESPIITADFIEWAKTYSGPKFNFIHCDFPYGIESNKNQQGGAVETHGGYDDSADIYWSLCNCLRDFINAHCADSVHIMFWFSMHFYSDTIRFFADNVGINFDPFPLIWVKSDNIGLLPDPSRGPRRIYETAFFGSRGDRKIVSAVSNAISQPTDRARHMSTKPVPVLSHFFRMFVDSTTIGLDPTCGSGSAVQAGLAGTAKYFIGLERNAEFAANARLYLNQGGPDGQAKKTTEA